MAAVEDCFLTMQEPKDVTPSLRHVNDAAVNRTPVGAMDIVVRTPFPVQIVGGQIHVAEEIDRLDCNMFVSHLGQGGESQFDPLRVLTV